jgi:hypothetical protein
MDENEIDQPADEVEVEDVEQAETDEVQTEEAPEDQAESDNEVTDDSEEIEFEGEKYKVPKTLKEAFLRQADYTRKTQEVAEQRREFEQQREAFQKQAQIQQQHIQDFAQLHAIDAQIERFQRVDWDALIDQDPVEAMKLERQYRTLTDTRNSTVQRIQQVEQQQAFENQQKTAKELEKGHEVLKREIPNWSPDKASELKKFAIEVLKKDPRAVNSIFDPADVLSLHYAKIGYQSLKKAATQPPKQEAKPVQKISSKRDTAKIDPDKLSPEEWAKWREKQLRTR